MKVLKGVDIFSVMLGATPAEIETAAKVLGADVPNTDNYDPLTDVVLMDHEDIEIEIVSMVDAIERIYEYLN